MASICPVCGGKLGLLNREKSADGLICAGCSSFFFSKLGFRAAKQPTAALAEYWATLESRRRTAAAEHLKRPIPSLTAMHSLSLSIRSTVCFTLDTAVGIKAHA